MSVAAQAVQNTGQTTPMTQNPQVQPSQDLGAATTDLQGSSQSQILASVPYQTIVSSPLTVVVPSSNNISLPAYSSAAPKPRTHDSARDILLIVGGFLLALFGVLALHPPRRFSKGVSPAEAETPAPEVQEGEELEFEEVEEPGKSEEPEESPETAQASLAPATKSVSKKKKKNRKKK